MQNPSDKSPETTGKVIGSVTTAAHLESRLRAIGQLDDTDIPLMETALLLSAWFEARSISLSKLTSLLAENTEYVNGLYRDVAFQILQQAETLSGATDAEKLESRRQAISTVLYDKAGFKGDQENYDDLDNISMISLLRRRRGMPVALGILFIELANQQGWAASGLSFPGHFLIRMDYRGQRIIIDPFFGGREVRTHELRNLIKVSAGQDVELRTEHYLEASSRSVLLRLQNNLNIRQAKSGDYVGLLDSLQTIQWLCPTLAHPYRERGFILSKLGRTREAIAALEQYLVLETNNPAKLEIAGIIQSLEKSVFQEV